MKESKIVGGGINSCDGSLSDFVTYQYNNTEYELTKIKSSLTDYKDGKQLRRERHKKQRNENKRKY